MRQNKLLKTLNFMIAICDESGKKARRRKVKQEKIPTLFGCGDYPYIILPNHGKNPHTNKMILSILQLTFKFPKKCMGLF